MGVVQKLRDHNEINGTRIKDDTHLTIIYISFISRI